MLYDGNCGFCAASVQFILRHERRHTLRFASLDSDIGRSIRARHPAVADVDSMIWVDDPDTAGERLRTRSAAGLLIARYMGGLWRVAAVGALIPPPIRDAVYDFVARHRHRLVPDADRCYVPPPGIRGRFLDLRS